MVSVLQAVTALLLLGLFHTSAFTFNLNSIELLRVEACPCVRAVQKYQRNIFFFPQPWAHRNRRDARDIVLRLGSGGSHDSSDSRADGQNYLPSDKQAFDPQSEEFQKMSEKEQMAFILKRLEVSEKAYSSEKEARKRAEDKLEVSEEARKQSEASRKQSEDKVVLLEGKRWVTINNLQSQHVQLGQCNFGPSVWLSQLVPQDVNTLIPLEKVSRDAPAQFFETDLFGRTKSGDEEMAHCIPHSRSTSKYWDRLLKATIKSKPNEPLLVQCIKEGFLKVAKGNRVDHSGAIYQPANYVCMAKQGTWFDNKPSVIIMPIEECSFVADGEWKGERFDAICIPRDDMVCRAIGAVDGFRQGDEISGTDPRVELAFRTFRNVSSAIIQELSRDDADLKKDNMKLSEGLRAFFRTQTTFEAPFPSPDPHAKYRLVRFSDGVVIPPGTVVDRTRVKAQGHPAPVPLLLIAKSLGAWHSFLLSTGKLDGVARPAGYESSAYAGYCSMLPICSLDDVADCPICLAKLVMKEHGIFTDLLEDAASYYSIKRIALGEEVVGSVASHVHLNNAAHILLRAIDVKVRGNQSYSLCLLRSSLQSDS